MIQLRSATKHSICLFMFTYMCSTSFLFATVNENDTLSKSTSITNSARYYCGLYCIFTASKILGKQIDFRDLLSPKYMSSPRGSSFTELKLAAQDFGVNAAILHQLTSEDIKVAEYPIILHAKATNTQQKYDHFVLFLGDINGKARIFDPPKPIVEIPYYELAQRWDESPFYDKGVIWLTNFDTTGVVDGANVKYDRPLKISGTKTYDTALGTSTIFVFEPYQIE